LLSAVSRRCLGVGLNLEQLKPTVTKRSQLVWKLNGRPHCELDGVMPSKEHVQKCTLNFWPFTGLLRTKGVPSLYGRVATDEQDLAVCLQMKPTSSEAAAADISKSDLFAADGHRH
jgi:hypothetical protein